MSKRIMSKRQWVLVSLVLVPVCIINIISCAICAKIVSSGYSNLRSFIVSYNTENNIEKTAREISSEISNDDANTISYRPNHEWRIKVSYDDETRLFWCDDIQTEYARKQRYYAGCLSDNNEWYIAGIGEWCKSEEGNSFIVKPEDLEWYEGEPKLKLFGCAGYSAPVIEIQNIKTYSFIRTDLYIAELKDGNDWW